MAVSRVIEEWIGSQSSVSSAALCKHGIGEHIELGLRKVKCRPLDARIYPGPQLAEH